MGLDIYFFPERKQSTGNWEPALLGNDSAADSDANRSIGLSRNSALFHVLSGTNSWRSGGDFESISEPRGLPDDLSPQIRELWERWTGEDASWLNAIEISEWDWSRELQREAMVRNEVAHPFDDNPLGFPRDPSSDGEEMSYAIYMANGVPVRWRETYGDAIDLSYLRDALGVFWGDPKIRFVFWYC